MSIITEFTKLEQKAATRSEPDSEKLSRKEHARLRQLRFELVSLGLPPKAPLAGAICVAAGPASIKRYRDAKRKDDAATVATIEEEWSNLGFTPPYNVGDLRYVTSLYYTDPPLMAARYAAIIAKGHDNISAPEWSELKKLGGKLKSHGLNPESDRYLVQSAIIVVNRNDSVEYINICESQMYANEGTRAYANREYLKQKLHDAGIIRVNAALFRRVLGFCAPSKGKGNGACKQRARNHVRAAKGHQPSHNTALRQPIGPDDDNVVKTMEDKLQEAEWLTRLKENGRPTDISGINIPLAAQQDEEWKQFLASHPDAINPSSEESSPAN